MAHHIAVPATLRPDLPLLFARRPMLSKVHPSPHVIKASMYMKKTNATLTLSTEQDGGLTEDKKSVLSSNPVIPSHGVEVCSHHISGVTGMKTIAL